VGWAYLWHFCFISPHRIKRERFFPPEPLRSGEFRHLLNMQNSLKFSLPTHGHERLPKHSPLLLLLLFSVRQEVLICCFCNQEPATSSTYTPPSGVATTPQQAKELTENYPRIQSKLKLARF
jgi:hypothetical protein